MSALPAAADITVSDGDAPFADYVRLSTMFCRSREISRYQGPVVRAVVPLLSSAFFCIALLRGRRPRMIAARCNGRLAGGLLVSRFGNLEAVVIDPVNGSHDECYRALSTRLEAVFAEEPKRNFGYWTLKPTLVQAGVNRGFHPTDRKRYLLTAELGPLRCSWLSPRPMRRRRVSCAPMYHMERGGE
jgi:hypothetical protein